MKENWRYIDSGLQDGAVNMAKAKFFENSNKYLDCMEHRDIKSLNCFLTRPDVEKKLVKRIKEKTKEITNNKSYIPKIICFFEKYCIPLTKEGQSMYLVWQCNNLKKKINEGRKKNLYMK